MEKKQIKKQSSLAFKENKCKYCNELYGSKKNTADRIVFNPVFCSAKCRNNYFAQLPQYKECIICGVQFKDRRSGNRIYCSQQCYWKNLKQIHPEPHSKNYPMIKIDGKRIREHRYVMEKNLGRKLKKNEIVHHKDGDITNNHPENLELTTQSKHIKQHFSKIMWGKQKN